MHMKRIVEVFRALTQPGQAVSVSSESPTLGEEESHTHVHVSPPASRGEAHVAGGPVLPEERPRMYA